MFGFFKKKQASPDAAVVRDDNRIVDITELLDDIDGIPVFSSAVVEQIVAKFPNDSPDTDIADELTAASRSWLTHLNDAAFDGALQSGESRNFMLYGDVDPSRGRSILAFAESTLERFRNDLSDIVWFGPASKMPILAFSDDASYYRYVSAYYPDGHFGLSSGMFLRRGLGHFVFPSEQMWVLEPVIAHELFHAVVAHLPLPAWLNEGLATNAEFKYGNRFEDPRHINDKLPHHRRYWNPERIQRFWSGESFFNADDGQELSYDLARRLVVGMSSDWEKLKAFILSANVDDAGENAALDLFGFSLGIPLEVATGIAGCPPDPLGWNSETFGGGFTRCQ